MEITGAVDFALFAFSRATSLPLVRTCVSPPFPRFQEYLRLNVF
jgi:hypothetical protein